MTNTRKPIPIVWLRGGGDLASGVALRLHRAGLGVVITELARPLAVRRLVAFSEAVYQGAVTVEGVTARRVAGPQEGVLALVSGEIPVFVDPEGDSARSERFDLRAVVDARMLKRAVAYDLDSVPLVIGLGPGFIPGENCHAAIETNRGPRLGRALWDEPPEPNTGVPGQIGSRARDRVLRAPADGALQAHAQIGEQVEVGRRIASVGGMSITAPFDGVLRGLLPEGMPVTVGTKVGDLDPRNDPRLALMVSEKALAIGGGVLEALLTRPEVRGTLWS